MTSPQDFSLSTFHKSATDFTGLSLRTTGFSGRLKSGSTPSHHHQVRTPPTRLPYGSVTAEGCQSLRPFSTSASSHFGLLPCRPFASSAYPLDTSAFNTYFSAHFVYTPDRKIERILFLIKGRNVSHGIKRIPC